MLACYSPLVPRIYKTAGSYRRFADVHDGNTIQTSDWMIAPIISRWQSPYNILPAFSLLERRCSFAYLLSSALSHTQEIRPSPNSVCVPGNGESTMVCKVTNLRSVLRRFSTFSSDTYATTFPRSFLSFPSICHRILRSFSIILCMPFM
jgi:hypothetical protein